MPSNAKVSKCERWRFSEQGSAQPFGPSISIKKVVARAHCLLRLCWRAVSAKENALMEAFGVPSLTNNAIPIAVFGC
jgi:hypothetical protein